MNTTRGRRTDAARPASGTGAIRARAGWAGRLVAVLLGAGLLIAPAVLAGCDLGLGPTGTSSRSGGSPGAATPGAATPAAATRSNTFVPSPCCSYVLPTPTPAPTPVAYTVVAGDSLGSIAARFRTTPRSIAFWNRTSYPSLDPYSATYAPDLIETGWTLSVLPGIVVDEGDLPSPSPTARPSLSIPPGPTPDPGGVSVVVSHGSRDANAVALTFDMGGRLDPALDIVDWLIAHDVRATIFPTGATGSGTTIGRAVLARVAAHPELFAVGNHSWDHPDFTKLNATEMTDQLTRTEAAIEPLVGSSTKPFFRPPYGAEDAAVRAAVGAAGWSYTVMWDVDTIDWKQTSDGGPTADDIAAKVAARIRGGSIVLMHLGGYHTLEALPEIVTTLRSRGLEPVTLPELLGR